jgi:GntR family transcriptional regulator
MALGAMSFGADIFGLAYSLFTESLLFFLLPVLDNLASIGRRIQRARPHGDEASLIGPLYVCTFKQMTKSNIGLAPLRQGGLPLHQKAEEAIRNLVAAPEYADGALLPDELTLADRLGISRGTVRAALGRLVAERRLERKAGVGTRVVRRSTESAMGAWRSFSREMGSQGVRVKLFRLELCDVPASQRVAAALSIKPGVVVQRLDRVRGWRSTPVLRSRSWFHPRVRFSLDEKFSRPLYELVADVSGLTAEHATEAFGADAATAQLARDLRVKRSSPLLLRRHVVFDPSNQPFEFAEVHYVSKRFTLTIDLKRETP